ncbi:unnamed protein product, partial [Rotaria sordida]
MCRRLQEHGEPEPIQPIPDEGLKRSARIAANTRISGSKRYSDSSDDRNGDTTVTTSKTHASSEIKSAVHRHMKEKEHNIDWKN